MFGEYVDSMNVAINIVSKADIFVVIGTSLKVYISSLIDKASGDIAFEPELQKCIAVDIRYVLLILDKYFDAQNLINEMKIVE